MNINTVGELRRALEEYDDDMVIEFYDNSDQNYGVTLMNVVPNKEELDDGGYEVLCICGDTLVTHHFAERSKW